VPRFDPAGPAALYKTYKVSAPRQTHFRQATCEEAACENYARGWVTIVDERTELGQRQAHFIRHDRTRRHAEIKTIDSALTEFVFEAGQTCFAASLHRVRTDRPDRLAVLGGDFRGNPAGIPARVHTRPEFFVEDWQEALDGARTAQERG